MKKAKKAAAVLDDVSADVIDADSEAVSDGKAGPTSDRLPDLSLVSAAKDLDSFTRDVSSCLKDLASGYIRLGSLFCGKEKSPLEASMIALGYSSVYDYAEKVFSLKPTTVKNCVAVYNKFGSPSGFIQDKFKDYSFSQLVELVPVQGDLDSFTPDLTVKEIRDTKTYHKVYTDIVALEDFIKGQVKKSWDGYCQELVVDFPSDFGVGTSEFSIRGKIVTQSWLKGGYHSFKMEGIRFDVSKGNGWSVDSWRCRVGNGGFYVACPRPTLAAFLDVAYDAIDDVIDGMRAAKEQRPSSPSSKSSKDSKAEKEPEKLLEWVLWEAMSKEDKIKSLLPEHLCEVDLHQFWLEGWVDSDTLLADVGSYSADLHDGRSVQFEDLGFMVIGSFASGYNNQGSGWQCQTLTYHLRNPDTAVDSPIVVNRKGGVVGVLAAMEAIVEKLKRMDSSKEDRI